jgi:hypothetical protein
MTLWHDMTCPLVARRLYGTVLVCLLVEAALVRSTPYSAKSGRYVEAPITIWCG